MFPPVVQWVVQPAVMCKRRVCHRGVVANFDLGERRVAVLGVGAGGGRPLPLRGSGVNTPEFFLRFLMPNPAFGGNLGQKIN